jgi:hypothetical protein
MNTDKTADFARTATRTMLDAHLKMVDATLAQTRIAEEQTAAIFAATRRNAELQKDLVQSLAKVWMDAVLPEAKPAAAAK